MIHRLVSVVAGLACVVAATGPVTAHPHVWVTMVEELLYAPDGSITGIRHRWTFDDMFAAFATQGIEQKTKGTFTRQELAPLAKVNVESLKEYAYFTYAKVDGRRRKDAFRDPIDYFLDYDPKADGAYAPLHATVEDAGKDQGARDRSLRSGVLHRFRFCGKGPGAAGRRAGVMHGLDREAARRQFPDDAAPRSGFFFRDLRGQHRHGCQFRQPDVGALSLNIAD